MIIWARIARALNEQLPPKKNFLWLVADTHFSQSWDNLEGWKHQIYLFGAIRTWSATKAHRNEAQSPTIPGKDHAGQRIRCNTHTIYHLFNQP